MVTGTAIRFVDVVPFCESAVINPVPLVFGTARALLAAKSAHGVDPRVDADPVDVKIGQTLFPQLFQT
jgi:hypothetical protein